MFIECFWIKTCQIVVKLYLKDLLLILFNIFMLIRDKVETREPIIRHQILTFLINRTNLFKLGKWYLAFFLCQSILHIAHANYQNKKPSCRWDSRPYCLTADYLVISDCCQITFPAVFEILGCKRIGARVWRGHVTSSVTWTFDFP